MLCRTDRGTPISPIQSQGAAAGPGARAGDQDLTDNGRHLIVSAVTLRGPADRARSQAGRKPFFLGNFSLGGEVAIGDHLPDFSVSSMRKAMPAPLSARWFKYNEKKRFEIKSINAWIISVKSSF